LGQRPVLPCQLRERATPVIAASERRIPVDPELALLLSGGAFQRGTTTVLVGPQGRGTTSLGIALMAHPSSLGHWCGVVGLRDLGAAAMTELGLDLRRAVFVPEPRAAWAEAAAELLDGVDLLFLCPPSRVPYAAARRLMARAKERRAVLLVRVERAEQWPVPPESKILLQSSSWQGLGRGEGHLVARRVRVCAEGRRGASRPVEQMLWLPARGGVVARAER
jgi:hypothetical protein